MIFILPAKCWSLSRFSYEEETGMVMMAKQSRKQVNSIFLAFFFFLFGVYEMLFEVWIQHQWYTSSFLHRREFSTFLANADQVNAFNGV